MQVDRAVLDTERVIEPFQLRYTLLEWHLTTLKASPNRVAGTLTLGTTACGLTAFAASAAANTLCTFV
jgi:hypothetical protein